MNDSRHMITHSTTRPIRRWCALRSNRSLLRLLPSWKPRPAGATTRHRGPAWHRRPRPSLTVATRWERRPGSFSLFFIMSLRARNQLFWRSSAPPEGVGDIPRWRHTAEHIYARLATWMAKHSTRSTCYGYNFQTPLPPHSYSATNQQRRNNQVTFYIDLYIYTSIYTVIYLFIVLTVYLYTRQTRCSVNFTPLCSVWIESLSAKVSDNITHWLIDVVDYIVLLSICGMLNLLSFNSNWRVIRLKCLWLRNIKRTSA